MSMTPVAQPHHLSRKAVIYIRQSTGHQVLTNTESQQLQHAMREHARHLGWPEERIEVVETDLGRSAQSTAGRDGYKALLAEVALGQVGIVLSYESTRLWFCRKFSFEAICGMVSPSNPCCQLRRATMAI